MKKKTEVAMADNQRSGAWRLDKKVLSEVQDVDVTMLDEDGYVRE